MLQLFKKTGKLHDLNKTLFVLEKNFGHYYGHYYSCKFKTANINMHTYYNKREIQQYSKTHHIVWLC